MFGNICLCLWVKACMCVWVSTGVTIQGRHDPGSLGELCKGLGVQLAPPASQGSLWCALGRQHLPSPSLLSLSHTLHN